jgi:hypothetical protein
VYTYRTAGIAVLNLGTFNTVLRHIVTDEYLDYQNLFILDIPVGYPLWILDIRSDNLAKQKLPSARYRIFK